MNALPSLHLLARWPRLFARVKAQPSELARGQARLWPRLGLLTAFWVYVALSNVLYANSMQASLTSAKLGTVYAPWDARLLQHAILYPALLACVWASLRVGWQPLRRALPLQVVLGLVFSALAGPVLWLSQSLLEPQEWAHMTSSGSATMGHGLNSWLASATSFLLTYGFALALITGFVFYQRLRDSELRSAALERALSAAQLAALRMQLSPHTLFNLLHTIRGTIAWDPASAQSMVVQLGDLLRGLLTAGEREFSRLQDEMQFVRLYLGLQQRRFADRLSVEVPQPQDLPRAWVPSLILQPLIENAVVHGLAGHDGPVSVRVEALAREETLLLRVTNTVGAQAKGSGAGIGLVNVRERLAIQFGERASLTATAGLDKVWLAEVRMPLLRDGAEAPRPVPREPTRAERA
jgi:hypothetical protein